MAIKVKHEGSAASRMAASAAGGAAKRAMEAAALAKPSQIQTLQAAHASAPSPSAPHAPLISAPGGGAHAGLIGGGSGIGAHFGGSRGARGVAQNARTVASGGGAAGDYKVTGTSIFNRPDDESTWDGQRWVREWLPGEKEAEARRRVGEVENELVNERELTAQGRRERAALVGEVVEAIKQGRFSRDEMPRLMEEFKDAEETLRMADSLREREPTAQEQFRKNTYTDDNGVVFSRDGKMIYNPNDAKMKQAEFAAKRFENRQTLALKFIADLMKPVKVGRKRDGTDIIRQLSYEEAEAEARKAFPDLYAQPAPSPGAPAPAGETQPATPVAGDPASFDQFKKRKQ